MTDTTTTTAQQLDVARVDGSDLLGDPEFLVARVRAIGSQNARDALKPFGLRVRAYVVLSLACGSVRPTQRDIADFLRLDPSQVVAVLDSLEASGLVRRLPDSRDRRVNIVEATELGISTYAKAREAIAASQEVSLAALTLEERETLKSLLLKVAF